MFDLDRTPPPLLVSDNFKEDITLEEVVVAVRKAKLRTAMGEDRVPTVFIKEGGEVLHRALKQLFNLVVAEERVPSPWASENTRMLHKGGSKLSLDNYRCITVASNVVKVFTRIWGTRLEGCFEDAGMLGEMQGGFRKGRSTAEHAFILNTMIEKAHSSRKRLCIAFVDLRKAYDTVNRERLWEVLREAGLGGKFLSIVQGLYQGHRKTVTLGVDKTRQLACSRGLKQGCVLSPLLFALFISDLSRQLHDMDEGVTIGSVTIPALFFADDIALVANSEGALQRKLELLQRFVSSRGLAINFDKTKIMKWGPGALSEGEWVIKLADGTVVGVIHQQRIYRYLGIWFGDSRRFLQHRKRKLGVIPRAVGLLKDKDRGTPVRKRAADLMWRQQVRESLLTGVEVVAYTQSWVRSVEVHQNKVGRWILGVSQRTSPEGVRAELGWFSVQNEIHRRKAIFYEHLMHLPDSRWVKQAMMEVLANQTGCEWYRGVLKARMALAPFLPSHRSGGPKTSWKNLLVRAVEAKRQVEWGMAKEASRILASHPTHQVGKPAAYVWESSRASRVLAHLRLGDVGGWMDREAGICPVCLEVSEGCLRDHVLLDCKACEGTRQLGELGQTLRQLGELHYSREQSIQTILGGFNPGRWRELGTMLSSWEEMCEVRQGRLDD